MIKLKNYCYKPSCLAVLLLISCQGMQGPDSLKAVRTMKDIRAAVSADNEEQGKVHSDHDHEEHHEDPEHGEHDHDDENTEKKTIDDTENWYDLASKFAQESAQDHEIMQLVIWRDSQKIWMRLRFVEDDKEPVFFSCIAHGDHLDCDSAEASNAPDIPRFENKEPA